MALRIPSPSDAYFPPILRGDEEIATELEFFREHPAELRRALTMASGYLRASEKPAMSAAALIALMTLYPKTDFST